MANSHSSLFVAEAGTISDDRLPCDASGDTAPDNRANSMPNHDAHVFFHGNHLHRPASTAPVRAERGRSQGE